MHYLCNTLQRLEEASSQSNQNNDVPIAAILNSADKTFHFLYRLIHCGHTQSVRYINNAFGSDHQKQ